MILFTFLGAGSYNETTYTLGEEKRVSCYSPAAAAHLLHVTSVTAFLTDEAEAIHREGLEQALPDGCQLKCVHIPYGRNENEFWEIFQALSQHASDDGDQAWDVTHGFRSLPLLSMLTLTFLRSGLGIKPVRVLYSLYEKNAESCPMIDLAPMLNLMDWASAADTFTRSGDSRPLASILNNIRNGFMREGPKTKQQQIEMAPVTDLAATMEDLSMSLALLRPSLITDAAKKLHAVLPDSEKALEFSSRTHPISLLLPRIGSAYKPLVLEDGSISSQLASWLNLIGWYIDRGYYAQAATLEREWLISWLMERKGKKQLLLNVEHREAMARILTREAEDFIRSKKDPGDLADIPNIRNIFGPWKGFFEIRNDLDHAGMRPQSKPPAAIIATIERTFAMLKNLPLEVE